MLTMPVRLGELTVEIRSKIVALSKKGYSVREIARRTGISKSSVGYTLQKFTTTGSYATAKRSGRPRKTTTADDRFIRTISKRDRQKTAPEIAAELNQHRDLPISVTTVKRRLYEVGLRGYTTVKKPLKQQDKIKRLEWAKVHENWSPEEWKSVLWTDKTKFEGKHKGWSITVWGCIGANMTGDLVKIDGTLKKEQYLNVLSNHAIPMGKQLIGQHFVIVQSTDSKHTAKICKNYLQELQESNMLKIMLWPPQSFDLNPVEQIWNELDAKMRKVHPKSESDLWNHLQHAWNQVTTDTVEKLITQMPKLVKAIKEDYFTFCKYPNAHI
ncbi:hypothetical protein KM043_014008 [Ampulex compressa]|nr:hypothetical protein KM043_014008 [Ampulex compressa]